MKIGIPEAYLQEGLDPEVRQAILRAAETFRSLGAEVETFELPLTEYAIPAYYLIASAEASSNLARFDGVKYGYRSPEGEGLHEMYKRSRSEGFGPEVKRRIMLGSFVLSAGYYDAYYLKALRTRALIRESYTQAFRTYDLLLAPGLSDHCAETWRFPGRSAENVSGRYSHGFRQSGRPSGHQHSLRRRFPGTSHRHAADRRCFYGEKDPPRRVYL